MSDAQRLRRQAERLLALATKAHDQGDHELAEQLTARAADYLDQAIAIEAASQPVAPSADPTQPDVQQQIKPPKGGKE